MIPIAERFSIIEWSTTTPTEIVFHLPIVQAYVHESEAESKIFSNKLNRPSMSQNFMLIVLKLSLAENLEKEIDQISPGFLKILQARLPTFFSAETCL